MTGQCDNQVVSSCSYRYSLQLEGRCRRYCIPGSMSSSGYFQADSTPSRTVLDASSSRRADAGPPPKRQIRDQRTTTAQAGQIEQVNLAQALARSSRASNGVAATGAWQRANRVMTSVQAHRRLYFFLFLFRRNPLFVVRDLALLHQSTVSLIKYSLSDI